MHTYIEAVERAVSHTQCKMHTYDVAFCVLDVEIANHARQGSRYM